MLALVKTPRRGRSCPVQKQADEWVIIHPVNVHTNYQSMNDILNICRLDIDNTDDDKWHEVKS